MVFAFEVLTSIQPCLSDWVKFIKKILFHYSTLAILPSWWHIPLIVHCTIWQIRRINSNFRVSLEILYKFRNLATANVARLQGFFRSWAKKYRYVVICASDGTYLYEKMNCEDWTIKYGHSIRCSNLYMTVYEPKLWKNYCLMTQILPNYPRDHMYRWLYTWPSEKFADETEIFAWAEKF